MPAPQKRTAPQQKSWLPIILLILLLGAGVAFLLWYFALSPKEPAVSYDPPAPETYSPPLATTPERLPPTPSPYLTDEGDPATTVDRAETLAETLMDKCQVVSWRIENFFAQLDQRDYIRQRQLTDGSLEHFGRLLDRLLANPPVVSGETSELYAILNNTAHFYRVLGQNDLWLVKDVITKEKDELEEILALLHQWSLIAPDCPPGGLNIHLPLPAIYEYAGFFLNTLGGRSYLFRRDAPVRLLATYYAVLTLDRANEAGINRHGLDIRPAINNLRSEIPGVAALRQKEEYLATLTELQDKYLRKYGP